MKILHWYFHYITTTSVTSQEEHAGYDTLTSILATDSILFACCSDNKTMDTRCCAIYLSFSVLEMNSDMTKVGAANQLAARQMCTFYHTQKCFFGFICFFVCVSLCLFSLFPLCPRGFSILDVLWWL